MVHVFATPYDFEGKTYEQLDFNLEGLKGSDIAAVKKQFTSAGNFAAVPAADYDFCAMMLARVCKLPLEFFTELPAKEYLALTQKVSNFLLA
ncbi:MAG: phage tail assembly protein [Candidatus Spyradenecus sp.]